MRHCIMRCVSAHLYPPCATSPSHTDSRPSSPVKETCDYPSATQRFPLSSRYQYPWLLPTVPISLSLSPQHKVNHSLSLLMRASFSSFTRSKSLSQCGSCSKFLASSPNSFVRSFFGIRSRSKLCASSARNYTSLMSSRRA